MKKFRMLGIIAVAVVIVFSMAGCGDDGGGGGGGGGGDNGTLTVRNIPSGTTEIWVSVGNANGVGAVAYVRYDGGISPRVRWPSPPIPLYDYISDDPFSRTGSFWVGITIIPSYDTRNVVASFTNGSATVDWNTMTE